MTLGRRGFLGAAGAFGAALAAPRGFAAAPRPFARVIVDNDFAGDPDGLYALAHHLLCPSVRIPLIVGSHLPPIFGPRSTAHTGTTAAAKARELIARMRLPGVADPLPGADLSIASRASWQPSPATAAIVREAMRDDTREPLVYAVGAGLTDLALAWLAEPRIGRRLKLVWIGGREHPGLAPAPPGPDEAEFNFSIDRLATQIVFNDSDIEIWQVPRDAYRQMLFPLAELDELAETGEPGRWLKAQVDGVAAMLAKIPGIPPAASTEVYVLGDSPLVTLTALLTPFQPDPASSRYVTMPTPRLDDAGRYQPNPAGRPMRVYTAIDAGLTFRDMSAKFRALARRQRG